MQSRLRLLFVDFFLHSTTKFQRLLKVVLLPLLSFFSVNNKFISVVKSKAKQNQYSSENDRKNCPGKRHPTFFAKRAADFKGIAHACTLQPLSDIDCRICSGVLSETTCRDYFAFCCIRLVSIPR